MREIKFRGKYKDSWVYGSYLCGVNGIELHQIEIVDKNEHRVYDVPKESVGEYTGLKDKNGKEIYEGDLVITEHELKGVIKYLGCCFMIEWMADIYSNLLGWDDYKRGKISDGSEYEVIGNVFENPELLK